MKKLYGLIGEKLGHSLSPQIQSMIMEKMNIDGYYHLFEIEKDNLQNACTGLKYLNIKGVNVTIPYKVEVMKALDEISDEAKKIGAVNTICFNKNRAAGFNTDYYGFGMMLKRFEVEVLNNRAVILGTGGAANSVIQYLMDNGIEDIVIVSRDISTVKDKFKSLKLCSYDNIKEIKSYDIIINCTPCGMYPRIDGCPVDPEIMKNYSSAVDLIYNPSETQFLKHAVMGGLKAVNGLYMLVAQAVKAQELWNDIRIPVEMTDSIYMKLSEQIDRGGLL